MKNTMEKTLGEITETRVEQAGPKGREFTYVDIGSIELDTKRIVDPKVLRVGCGQPTVCFINLST